MLEVVSVMAAASVIAIAIVFRNSRRQESNAIRSLMINALGGFCFSGPFLRAGWDKALVAFLFVFVIASLFNAAFWLDQRRHDVTATSHSKENQ